MASRKAPVDMYTVSQVPGYKTVMRAVLKAQIHHLIVQLSEIGGEDSVLLTASVENGTLTHLGSDVAESFVEDHDNLKTEFLDHCIQAQKKRPYTSKLRTNIGLRSKSQAIKLTSGERTNNKRYAPYNYRPDGTCLAKVKVTAKGSMSNRSKTNAECPNDDKATAVKGIKMGNIGEDDQSGDTDKEHVSGDSDDDFGDEDNGIKTEPSSEIDNIGSEMDVNTDDAANNVTGDTLDDSKSWDEDAGEEEFREPPKKITKCHVCGEEFSVDAHLKSHFTMYHPDLQPYKCEICGTCICSKRDLERHMNVHSDLRPFQCSVCGKGFRHSRNLKDHEFIHTGLKPFKCEVCKRRFRNKHVLKSHSYIHTGEKPFICQVCGNCFRTSGDMKAHSVVHSSEKPFECHRCEKAFKRQSHLRKHLKNHPNTVTVMEEVVYEGICESPNEAEKVVVTYS